MASNDRRLFAPFLSKWFPELAKASSEELHFFLDKVTGIETPLDMPNAVAFDRWREKLAGIGYPAFQYSDADIAAIKAKADAMLAAEQARAASMSKTLVELAKEAPNWPVADVLASVKGATK
jgi:hypothetical protein